MWIIKNWDCACGWDYICRERGNNYWKVMSYCSKCRHPNNNLKKDFKPFVKTYFNPTPNSQENWMYNKVQEIQKDLAKKHEEFIYDKLWSWKILPKFLLKKIFILENKQEFWRMGWTNYQILRNKITWKKYTFITEYAIWK